MGLTKYIKDLVVDQKLTAETVDAQVTRTEEATINGKRLYIQSTPPSNPETDDVWIDTS